MLSAGDGLPAQVCPTCVQQVNTSYSFKLQCETSDETLRQLLDFQQTQLQDENCEVTSVKEESDEVTIEDNNIEFGHNDVDDDAATTSTILIPVPLFNNIFNKETGNADKIIVGQQDNVAEEDKNVPRKIQFSSLLNYNKKGLFRMKSKKETYL